MAVKVAAMKKYLIIYMLFPAAVFTQYFGERVTEKSFEESSLFFNSYYMNTFGLRNFKDVSVGLIDDPFLELYLNPAHLPKLTDGRLIYWDFRSDRTEEPITQYPRLYNDYLIAPPQDPRWPSLTRQEAEPFFSVGILTYPFREKRNNLFLGGTYQIIHKAEKFYTVPDWIYYAQFGYDAFGTRIADSYMPVVDRFSGTDEMLTTSHLFSVFAGYKLSGQWDLGISLNGAVQSRDGSYLNSSQDPYTQSYNWNSFHEERRNQEYHHLDWSGGLRYHLSPETAWGVKVGYLTGKVKYSYSIVDSSNYDYNNDPNNWSYNFSQNRTGQNWDHDGRTWYGSVDFTEKLSDQKDLRFYYRYTLSDIDLVNASLITDTAVYSSQYTWNPGTSHYYGNSSVRDVRNGTGSTKKHNHQAAVNIKYQLTDKSDVLAGINFSYDQSRILSSEPVTANRISDYSYTNPTDSNASHSRLTEDKRLVWKYRSWNWKIQIPVLVHHQFSEHWNMVFGINRILGNWKIKEETTAYYTRREQVDNGNTIVQTNFGERYRQPDQKRTDNSTAVMAGIGVMPTQNFNINLIVNPQFDHPLAYFSVVAQLQNQFLGDLNHES